MIKCVIWDLDNTLFRGVYLESAGQRPAVDPAMSALLTELAGRGVLHAIVSKNPPQAASYASEATGHRFAAVRCGWGAKSAALSQVLDELGLTPREAAFVDDDAMERAEVSFTLPGVLVLEPRDMADAAGWPQFSPRAVTAEARRRGEMYAQRTARREEAAAFRGSPEAFLRHCGTQVRIAMAGRTDLARLHELSVRTHQFNSAGIAVSPARFAELVDSPRHRVATAALRDDFGDDGLVGAAVITPAGGTWRVPLLMMSCRAIGRGVIGAFLSWICLAAARAGAADVAVACVVSERNVPLRIALASAGFRADDDQPPWAWSAGRDRIAGYRFSLSQPLPRLPDLVVEAPS